MTSTRHIPLCVPWWDESDALGEGARYDPLNGFYAPDDNVAHRCWKWLPRMYDPDAPRPVLVPEMLPVTTWEQNVRHLMGTERWDRIRKHAYKAAGFRCEICAARGRLEAHELWRLENETQVQKLERILALCPLCHKAHHLGIARRLGMYGEVREHLKRVNGWSERELEAAIADTYETWQQRCDWPWQVDLSFLHDNGYLYV